MASNQIKGIFEYSSNTGLKISSRKEILDDLESLTKVAYGQDYIIERGNSWYTFLDLLAGSLVTFADTTQKVYNALSAESATGAELDNVVSLFGIVRKVETPSSVTIKITITTGSNIVRPLYVEARTIRIKDSNGIVWINKDPIYIYEYTVGEDGNATTTPNYIGTCTFIATGETAAYSNGVWAITTNAVDPTNVELSVYNNGTSDFDGNVSGSGDALSGGLICVGSNSSTYSPDNILFVNDVNSNLGWGNESDAQLRTRWANMLFSTSIGTVEGLKAQILNTTDISYVDIIENPTSSITNGMSGHSIWVIVNGNSTWNGENGYSTDPSDINIAETILMYKSIGCAVSNYSSAQPYSSSSGTGLISVQIARGSENYKIVFSRASSVGIAVSINLSSADGAVSSNIQSAINAEIRSNIQSYVQSLGIHKSVTTAGLISAAYAAITNRNLPTINVTSASMITSNNGSVFDGTISYDQYAMLDTEYTSSSETYISGVEINWSVA